MRHRCSSNIDRRLCVADNRTYAAEQIRSDAIVNRFWMPKLFHLTNGLEDFQLSTALESRECSKSSWTHEKKPTSHNSRRTVILYERRQVDLHKWWLWRNLIALRRPQNAANIPMHLSFAAAILSQQFVRIPEGYAYLHWLATEELQFAHVL